jgi:2-haloacid dehalogenase
VPSCLSELKDSGYTIMALTNAPEKLVFERMERTGLVSYFDEVLSAETVKKYKPDKTVYQWAAEKIKSNVSEILLITAHGWDIAGAANAGMKTAFLKRHKEFLFPLSPEPDLTGNQLSELVSVLTTLK